MWFLNAIALNPKAKHIWAYLEGAWISNKDVENLQNFEHGDVRVFEAQHNVHDFNELPEPEGISYADSFERYLLKDKIENWITINQEQQIKEVKEPGNGNA